MPLRLDTALVTRGLAPSRERARALILAGNVRVGDQVVTKAGASVGPSSEIRLRAPDHPYVSRGGVKLAGALDALGVEPRGLVCIDVGASTGGFTDLLLARGAARVYAVDVGWGLLDARLRADSRVVLRERVNARYLDAAVIPEPMDLATIDVSFISLRLVLPAVHRVLAPNARVLALVKPQFEVGRGGAKKGVVREEAVRQATIERIAEFARETNYQVEGQSDSVLRGPKGNLETFLLLRRCESS